MKNYANIPYERRHSDNAILSVAAAEEKLNKTFKLWPQNLFDLVKNEEDVLFLNSMMTDRVASFGSFDAVLHGVLKRQQDRDVQAEQRRIREFERKALSLPSTSYRGIADDEDLGVGHKHEIEEKRRKTDDSDDEFVIQKPSKDKSNPQPKGTAAYIRADIMNSPKLTALATRMKLTPTQQAAYTEAIIEEAGEM